MTRLRRTDKIQECGSVPGGPDDRLTTVDSNSTAPRALPLFARPRSLLKMGRNKTTLVRHEKGLTASKVYTIEKPPITRFLYSFFAQNGECDFSIASQRFSRRSEHSTVSRAIHKKMGNKVAIIEVTPFCLLSLHLRVACLEAVVRVFHSVSHQ